MDHRPPTVPGQISLSLGWEDAVPAACLFAWTKPKEFEPSVDDIRERIHDAESDELKDTAATIMARDNAEQNSIKV
jgi:hypothetical protein